LISFYLFLLENYPADVADSVVTTDVRGD